MDQTTLVAQSITRAGSKQAYYTARLMVDRHLVTDFFKAYAYFRWIDDVIDITAGTDEERITFIKRQRTLIEGLYNQSIIPADLCTEEQILADLIRRDRDREAESGLRSFIMNGWGFPSLTGFNTSSAMTTTTPKPRAATWPPQPLILCTCFETWSKMWPMDSSISRVSTWRPMT